MNNASLAQKTTSAVTPVMKDSLRYPKTSIEVDKWGNNTPSSVTESGLVGKKSYRYLCHNRDIEPNYRITLEFHPGRYSILLTVIKIAQHFNEGTMRLQGVKRCLSLRIAFATNITGKPHIR